MAITVTVETPRSILMNRSENTTSKKWNWGNLSDAEIKAELDRSYKQAQKDIAAGKGQPAAEFFKEFKAEHSEWFTR